MEKESIKLTEQILTLIREKNSNKVLQLLKGSHPADIAELLHQLEPEDQSYIIKTLDSQISSDVLIELEEEDRKLIIKNLTAKEIAVELNEMDTDDAVDVIAELSDQLKDDVIAQISDQEYAKNLVELLRYDEDTAGGLMGKELIKVNQNWNVITAVKEMRKQAENMEEVFSIYVVDDQDKLLGTLSLKRLLTTSSTTKLEKLYNNQVRAVKVYEKAEEVANTIQKYDLYEVPVVDELGVLLGIITVDDVIDVIREEAEKDYQLASGISKDVDMEDSILQLTKARLPWLIIGVFGGVLGSLILKSNEQEMQIIPMLTFFIPLIAATAGNVGVQSSAIVVQGLANGNLKGTLSKNLTKEVLLALVSGLALSLIIFIYNLLFNRDMEVYLLTSVTISIALFFVVLISASIGTIVPLVLNKRGIDPALATGPFITTTNDLLGIIVYFLIAKIILGI